MRDIRPDLRERLEAEQAAHANLELALDAVEERIEHLEMMLATEDARFAAEAEAQKHGFTIMPSKEGTAPEGVINGRAPEGAFHATPTPAPNPAVDIDEFLVKAVARGVKEKDELRDAAIRAGYFNGSQQSPGRVVHAKLLNLVRDGRITKTGDEFAAKAA